MKKLIIISSFAIASISVAQDKLLTIQDAVLKGRTTLAPKRLQSLGFIPSHNQFSYVDKNIVFIGDKKNGNTVPLITLQDLNTKLKASSKDTLAAIGGLTWKNLSQFYFYNKKAPHLRGF
jgi:hypothetical protein